MDFLRDEIREERKERKTGNIPIGKAGDIESEKRNRNFITSFYNEAILNINF